MFICLVLFFFVCLLCTEAKEKEAKQDETIKQQSVHIVHLDEELATMHLQKSLILSTYTQALANHQAQLAGSKEQYQHEYERHGATKQKLQDALDQLYSNRAMNHQEQKHHTEATLQSLQTDIASKDMLLEQQDATIETLRSDIIEHAATIKTLGHDLERSQALLNKISKTQQHEVVRERAFRANRGGGRDILGIGPTTPSSSTKKKPLFH